jgi:uncharacterized protein YkwD
MIISALNDFRKSNDKNPVFSWDPVENDYCEAHCRYMAWHNHFEHTPEYLLKGKAEAIAMIAYGRDNEETIRRLIYDVLGTSREHKNIILNFKNLAYGFYAYNNCAYLTIRGWNG